MKILGWSPPPPQKDLDARVDDDHRGCVEERGSVSERQGTPFPQKGRAEFGGASCSGPWNPSAPVRSTVDYLYTSVPVEVYVFPVSSAWEFMSSTW